MFAMKRQGNTEEDWSLLDNFFCVLIALLTVLYLALLGSYRNDVWLGKNKGKILSSSPHITDLLLRVGIFIYHISQASLFLFLIYKTYKGRRSTKVGPLYL